MTKPLTSDAFDILLGHNRWANRTILQHSRPLTIEQFHQPFDIGPAVHGGLHDLMTHTIGATFRWADRIDRRELRPSIEGRPPSQPQTPMTRRSLDELLALNESACDDFAAAVSNAKAAGALAEVRDWTFGDRTYRFNVATAIIHVTNHGMHHRAQAMNIVKRLGIPFDGDLDELEWQLAGEP